MHVATLGGSYVVSDYQNDAYAVPMAVLCLCWLPMCFLKRANNCNMVMLTLLYGCNFGVPTGILLGNLFVPSNHVYVMCEQYVSYDCLVTSSEFLR